MAQRLYRRLSTIRTLGGFRRWYAGSDHLLLVERVGFVQYYRRLFFSDIQSVVIWPTRLREVRMGLEAVLFALVIWLFVLVQAYPFAGFLILAGVATLMIELALGPSAGGEIRTPTSRVTVPLASRYRKSVELLASLYDRCASVQGSLPGAAPTIDLRAWDRESRRQPTANGKLYRGTRWSAAVWLLIALELLSVLNSLWVLESLRQFSVTQIAVASVIGVSKLCIVIWAAIAVQRFRVWKSVRVYVWSAVGVYAAGFVGSMIELFRVLPTLPLASSVLTRHQAFMSAMRPLTAALASADFLMAIAGLAASAVAGGHFEPAPQPEAADQAIAVGAS